MGREHQAGEPALDRHALSELADHARDEGDDERVQVEAPVADSEGWTFVAENLGS